MSLLAEAAALASRKGGTCGVSVLEQTLDPAERAELLEALTSTVEGSAISKALAARGYHVKPNAIQRHRRQDCACPPLQVVR
jgi:hypothetical protein